MDIENSLQAAFDKFFAFLPNLLGFLVILLVGWIIAKVVATIVRKGLEKLGLDKKLHESDASKYVDAVLPGASPSAGIAKLVFWLIFIFFLFAAIGALQIPAVTTFMNEVLAYLPNVIVAVLIFVIAAIISGAVATGVNRTMGDTSTGRIVAAVGPALVMVIAMFMILEQLQIAPEIVRIAFAATMFALALGLALAFGLGGRGVAERLLEDAYRKGRENKEQIKRDLQTGRARAEQKAHDVDRDVSGTGSSTGATATNPYPTGGTDAGGEHAAPRAPRAPGSPGA